MTGDLTAVAPIFISEMQAEIRELTAEAERLHRRVSDTATALEARITAAVAAETDRCAVLIVEWSEKHPGDCFALREG